MLKDGGVVRMQDDRKLPQLSDVARYGRAVLAGLLITTAAPVAAHAGDYYDSPQSRLDGFYVGALGQYTYANARFRWDGETIIDRDSHNWGVGGVLGYGWLWDSFYFGPEGYFNYMDISNRISGRVGDVTRLSIDREVEAGINLLIGFTGFDDSALFYGLIGGGATSFSGKITTEGIGNLNGDIWYPVLSLGGGVDWSISQSTAVRFQVVHTFYYDASDHIFPSATSQSYDLDTTAVSIGLIWRPWN